MMDRNKKNRIVMGALWCLLGFVLVLCWPLDVFAVMPAKKGEIDQMYLIGGILSGVAFLMALKAGLEFLGILPTINPKEFKDASNKISENNKILSGQVAEVCKVETGRTPPAWCTAEKHLASCKDILNRDAKTETLLAQNSVMSVKLLEEILEHQKSILRRLEEIERKSKT